MGIGMWLAAGSVAWLLARIIPAARPFRPWWEMAAALVTSLLLGLAATALDFGGWQEPDWRAGLFAFFGALAVVGFLRLLRRGEAER